MLGARDLVGRMTEVNDCEELREVGEGKLRSERAGWTKIYKSTKIYENLPKSPNPQYVPHRHSEVSRTVRYVIYYTKSLPFHVIKYTNVIVQTLYVVYTISST